MVTCDLNRCVGQALNEGLGPREQEFQKKQSDFRSSAAAELMSLEGLDKYLQAHACFG